MEENAWLHENLPGGTTNRELSRNYHLFKEGFKCLLGDVGVSTKYARMYEERVKIAIAEVRIATIAVEECQC